MRPRLAAGISQPGLWLSGDARLKEASTADHLSTSTPGSLAEGPPGESFYNPSATEPFEDDGNPGCRRCPFYFFNRSFHYPGVALTYFAHKVFDKHPRIQHTRIIVCALTFTALSIRSLTMKTLYETTATATGGRQGKLRRTTVC